MKRIDKILNHDLFNKLLSKNNAYERDRIFCRHNMEHFLSVARIAQILNLKQKLKLDKALVYGAALLHDIGRFRQYEDGTPHESASARLAGPILRDSGFTREETELILDAIRNHRNGEIQKEKSLRGILYRADKLSRSCFACPVEQDCNWKGNKKNLKLRY